MPHRALTARVFYAAHKLTPGIFLACFECATFRFAARLRLAGELAAIKRIGKQKLTIARKVRIAFERAALFSHLHMPFTTQFFHTVARGAIAHMWRGRDRCGPREGNEQREYRQFFHRNLSKSSYFVDTSFATMRRTIGATTSTAGNAHAHATKKACIHFARKLPIMPRFNSVKIPDMMNAIIMDMKNAKTTEVKRAGIMESSGFTRPQFITAHSRITPTNRT
jgi:hypothetical protein